MPNSVTWTPVFEWIMIRCGFKIGHQKDTILKEKGLICAQILLTNLGSLANIIGEGGTWSFYGSCTFDFEIS